ncbi:hypothetical protein GCM10023306_01950 [Novosphingobium ginsenosidimutans]
MADYRSLGGGDLAANHYAAGEHTPIQLRLASKLASLRILPPSRGKGQERKSFLISGRSARMAWAALWPGAPVTPPPGWVPAPHM